MGLHGLFSGELYLIFYVLTFIVINDITLADTKNQCYLGNLAQCKWYI